MTFAHYDFVRGSFIHEHFHPQEAVWELIEGEIELTIDGVAHIARPGLVGIVPGNVRHSVKALTDGPSSWTIRSGAMSTVLVQSTGSGNDLARDPARVVRG